MNQYPLWKYLLILAALVVGIIYALPNLYGNDPALQISSGRGAEVTGQTAEQVRQALQQANLPMKSVEPEQDFLLVRFPDTDSQLRAYDVVRETLGARYPVALNLAPAAPEWLAGVGALPMYLGLDLRGGVHFLMEVDMDAAVAQSMERYVSDIRSLLREERVRYLTVNATQEQVEVRFRDVAELERAHDVLRRELSGLTLTETERGGSPYLVGVLSEQERREIQRFALQQNITTLRNRVNELGVAEPIIQQQGEQNIVVQLPGVQDTVRAKEILGATATLEYRLVDEAADPQAAVAGRVPPGSALYYERNGQPIVLKRDIIVTGDQVIDAASGLDQNGAPMVSVTLDARGAREMGQITRDNIGRRMAVVFIENRPETKLVNGEARTTTRRVEEVISVAVIRDHFSKRFQTTGLDGPDEARNLALLLRAGALAAPMEIVEERTVGPSLGQDNIDQGFLSVVIAFVLVLVFMAVWYKGFGLVANVVLAVNLIIIVAVLSMLQATLTLPGIAGIVLTVGMAVDANVLIFERIKEELRNGNSPQASIHAGYDKALSTIADSNITTLIAAIVLFSFGTGPVKGFAVTLSIGILTSMFTAIMGSRAIVNLVWGRRRLAKLPI